MNRRMPYIPGLTPSTPAGANIVSVTTLSITSNQITQKSFITNGPANGTATLTLTYFTGSDEATEYFYAYPLSDMMLTGETFTIALDATGAGDFTTILHRSLAGTSKATLVITAVSAGGTVGPYASHSYTFTHP